MRLEVFPTFSVYVHLQELCALELVHGYYQVRVSFKPTPLFDCQLSHCFSTSIDDSSSIDNLTGISRVAKIAFKEQFYNLNSAFRCRANATKRLDRCDTSLMLPMQIELYYLKPEFGTSNEDFRLISKRLVNINLRTDKSIHCHRSIFFEFFAFSMVSVTIHASMISAQCIRRKVTPDPPISNKLRQFHSCICQRFILSLLSLQDFMQRYSHLLTSPLKIQTINGADEEKKLHSELELAEMPWNVLQEHIEFFNNRLSALFNQLLQIFAKCKDFCEALLLDVDQQRFKQLSEAFLFVEDAAQLLLTPNINQIGNVIELVKKADYLQFIPQLPVQVVDMDVNTDEFTIIVEQRFLSSCSTESATTFQNFQLTKPFATDTFFSSSLILSNNIHARSKSTGFILDDFTNLDSTLIIAKSQILPNKLEEMKLTSCSNQKYQKKSVKAATSRIESRRQSQSRNIFEFCLPIGRHNLTSRQDCGDQYCELSPDSLLLKRGVFHAATIHGNNNLKLIDLDRRRMTDPGARNGILCDSSNISFDSSTTPAVKSLTPGEISPKKLTLTNNNNVKNLNELKHLITHNGSGESSHSSGDIVTTDNDKAQLLEKSKFKRSNFKYSTIDNEIVEFVKKREFFKQQLYRLTDFRGYLYCESIIANHGRFICFSKKMKNAIERRTFGNIHLIICVHGLEGTSDDLTTYKNYLRIAHPDQNLVFLLSKINKRETWSDLNKMAENLLTEIDTFIQHMPLPPTRISLVAHSLGGLIVRAMSGLPGITRLSDKFYTLMTLNSPHCGLLYNQRTASWGLSILQWWKRSACLEQLTLRDASDFRNTFLYKLSQNGAFALFRNVLLVGSIQDLYVPSHSALIEQCKASMVDQTDLKNVYTEMLSNINESIVASPCHTIVVKYCVAHAVSNVSKAQQVTGRAAHIAAVDDDTFVEKLISVSVAKYFK